MKFIKTIIRKLKPIKFNLEEHNVIMAATSKLTKIRTINYGGCGIAAVALYRYLEKQGLVNDTTHIKFMYRHKANKKDILESCSHAVLSHNGIDYDSNGKFVDHNRFSYIVKLYGTDEAVKSINNQDTWNTSFNRVKNCCRIAWSLRVSLKDISR